MKTFKLILLSVPLLVLLYSLPAYSFILPPSVEPGTLYGAAHDSCGSGEGAGPSTLYLVDPETADTTPVGAIGFSGVSGLAFLPDGRLVGSARGTGGGGATALLIEIDPATGSGSLIGQIGAAVQGSCGRVPDITYDPFNDILFGLGDRCNNNFEDDSLLRINLESGIGTVIGKTGFDGSGNGLALVNNKVMYQASNSSLYVVNRTTGKSFFVADLDQALNALAFNALTGELFGSIDAGELYTIDTSEGTVNFIGDIPDCFDALVFAPSELPFVTIPTLSQWGLIAMAGLIGLVGFIVVRKRKAAA